MDTAYCVPARLGEGLYKDKGSRFLAFAYPFEQDDDLETFLLPLRKMHPKAVHYCYAYRLGVERHFRLNDDGEPSGSAGSPILGQIDARELSDCLVIVVRYFGGTLLGVPGLIQAYKSAAAAALDAAGSRWRERESCYRLRCDYADLNSAMRLIEYMKLNILQQETDLQCRLRVAVPLKKREEFLRRLTPLHHIDWQEENDK